MGDWTAAPAGTQLRPTLGVGGSFDAELQIGEAVWELMDLQTMPLLQTLYIFVNCILYTFVY